MTALDLSVRWEETALAREDFLTRFGMLTDSRTPSTINSNPRLSGVRRLVLDSWQRSGDFHVNPELDQAPVVLVDDDLEEARKKHMLGRVLPAIRKLLVEDDSGVIVAVGDPGGQLLWLEGDRDVMRRAEHIGLTPGSRWSECDVGTNGIGTAIEVGDVVQVFGSEHFASPLLGWSCAASPVHDPATGDVVGFFNVSGGTEVALPQSALLVRSAVAAVEAELRLLLRGERTSFARGNMYAAARPTPARLSVLGHERARLEIAGQSHTLSHRHGELLLLLSTRPDGISASELGWLLYEEEAADVTVRAEISRLRKAHPELLSAEHPYRLCRELRTDAGDVSTALRSCALERAVELYRGPVLPRSTAPGVVDHRYYLNGWLRSALIRAADGDLLMRYAHSPEGEDDAEVWRACRNRLPADSPRQAEVSAALASINRRFS